MTQHSPIHTRDTFNGGTQKVYRFPNGYGASLITGWPAYGGLEMAVVRFAGEGWDDFGLTYDTPITDDVLGHLSPDEVDPLLDSIAALPNPAEVSA